MMSARAPGVPHLVCLAHVTDGVFRSRLVSHVDAETTCNLCGANGALDFGLVAGIVRDAVYERYKPAPEWNAPWDEIEAGDETPLYDLTELLDELTLYDAVDSDLHDALVCSFGPDTMWVTTYEYDMRPRDKDVLGWSEFCELVKHKSRYLQLDEQSFVAETYGMPSPGKVLKRVGKAIDRQRLYRTIATTEILWRGRADARRRRNWTANNLTSAPSQRARQSRMSAAGISVFYGAFDIDTVAAELADDDRRWLMAGAFQPTRALTVIDLTVVPLVPSPFAESAARDEDELGFLRRSPTTSLAQ